MHTQNRIDVQSRSLGGGTWSQCGLHVGGLARQSPSPPCPPCDSLVWPRPPRSRLSLGRFLGAVCACDARGRRNPTPHPTPHNLHPAPYTLHPTSYTLRPTLRTLHPTPCALNPTLSPPNSTPRQVEAFLWEAASGQSVPVMPVGGATLHPTPYTPHPTPCTLPKHVL